MDRFSRRIPLEDYEKAPQKRGVYEIGILVSSRFERLYIGKSENDIRGRLREHFKGRGNKHIKRVQDEEELFCRWMIVDDPSCVEAQLLKRYHYPANRRTEKTERHCRRGKN
jgi:predicted GIY-YIG superfamily endonuclease